MEAKDKRTAETIVQESITQLMRGARLEWADHVWEAENSIIKTVLVNNISKKRARGRTKQRWLDVVKREIIYLRPEWIGGDLNHAYIKEE